MTVVNAAFGPIVGASAPDVTLPSTAGEKVTRSSLRGKPGRIAFSPLAFSSICTAELCEMREVSRRYDVLLEDRFYSNRAYFLIDRDGIVQWKHVEETPSHRRDDPQLFAAIDALL